MCRFGGAKVWLGRVMYGMGFDAGWMVFLRSKDGGAWALGFDTLEGDRRM